MTDQQTETLARLSESHAPRDGRNPAEVGEVLTAFLDRRAPPAVEVWISGIFYHIEPEGDAHS
jgi:hypothetical protein